MDTALESRKTRNRPEWTRRMEVKKCSESRRMDTPHDPQWTRRLKNTNCFSWMETAHMRLYAPQGGVSILGLFFFAKSTPPPASQEQLHAPTYEFLRGGGGASKTRRVSSKKRCTPAPHAPSHLANHFTAPPPIAFIPGVGALSTPF